MKNDLGTPSKEMNTTAILRQFPDSGSFRLSKQAEPRTTFSEAPPFLLIFLNIDFRKEGRGGGRKKEREGKREREASISD